VKVARTAVRARRGPAARDRLINGNAARAGRLPYNPGTHVPDRTMADRPPTPPADELLRLLTEQARDHALILLDPDGVVVGWRAAAERVLGYPAAEVVGRPFTFLFTPEDLARGLDRHELDVARSVGKAEDDRWQVRKNGTRIWAAGILTALTDAAGTVVGFGKVLRDRTDTKAQIESLEAQAEAHRRAAAQRDEALAKVAHELRGPLTPLGGAVALARLARPDDPKLAGPLATIDRQVATLGRLADDLMDVTGLGLGKVRLSHERVDLVALLRELTDSYRPAAAQAGLTLEAVLPAGPLDVRADPVRLRQAFGNLIANAIKYTPAGGRVWVKPTGEGAEAVVRVEDTGVGIGPDVLPRIFDLFTQDEAAAGRSAGGLGIGLALVKELVERHGGLVHVRSDGQGKGSEFVVRLPLDAGDGPEPPGTDGPGTGVAPA
jgi:PAS domain S-box-containing protein